MGKVFVFLLFLFTGTGVLPGQLTQEVKLGEPLPSQEGVYFTYTYPGNENGLVNLRVEDGQFVLYFLDKERNLVVPPHLKAVVRYEELRGGGEEIMLLQRDHSSNGLYLSHPRHPDPPHLYRVILVLLDNPESGLAKKVFPLELLRQ